MIKALLFDLSNTLLFAKDRTYKGGLNKLNMELREKNPNYDFNQYFELDAELMDYLKSQKGKYKIALYTSESIQNEPAIKTQLDEVFFPIFSAKEIGFEKTNQDAYKYIAEQLSVSPDEILFIDDSQANIDPAHSVGVHTLLYRDFADLRRKIESSL